MPVDYNVQARIAYLKWITEEDAAQQQWVRTLRDYASGEHPTYLTDRQQNFVGLKAKNTSHLFAHNLCSLVIAVVVERLAVTGFAAKSATEGVESQLALSAAVWWELNRADALQDDLYEAACRDGEAYVIVDWPKDEAYPRWTVNDRFDGTSGVEIHYDPEDGVALFASKRWQTYDVLDPSNTGRARVTLYFPDRVERYIEWHKGDVAADPDDVELQKIGWRKYIDDGQEWPAPWVAQDGNPLGIAAIPFKNPGGAEIDDIVSLQDILNKTDLDLVAGADAAGFRLLYLSGVDAELDSDGEEKAIEISPAQAIRITNPQGRLGAIEPADLTRMIATCEYWVRVISFLSRTPLYLLQKEGAVPPSGESLKMQETGLIDKCARKHKVLGNAWEDVIYLSQRLAGAYGGLALADERLEAEWQPVQTRFEKEKWEVAKAKQDAGIPEAQTWIDAGYTAEEVEKMKQMKEEERAAGVASFGAAMAEAARRRDQGEEV